METYSGNGDISRISHCLKRSVHWSLDPGGQIVRTTSRLVKLGPDDYETRKNYTFKSAWEEATVHIVQASKGMSPDSLKKIDPSTCIVKKGHSGKGTEVTIPWGNVKAGMVVSSTIREIYKGPMLPGHVGFAPVHIFEDSLPVYSDSFAVSVPENMKLTYIARRMSANSVPRIQRVSKVTTYTWEVVHLVPYINEPLMPSRYRTAPIVRTTVATEWRVIAQWMGGALSRNMEVSGEVKRIGEELVSAHEMTDATAQEKVHFALKKLRTLVRYVDLPVGVFSEITGNDCNKIIERGYGDCVDHSLLLSTLLNAMGVSAIPVFIASVNSLPIEPQLPTPYCGDHCIVKVGKGKETFFVDPVYSEARTGQLPPEYDGCVCFSPLTEEFFRTPLSTYEEHGIDCEHAIVVSSDGTYTGKFKIKTYGHERTLIQSFLKRTRRSESAIEKLCFRLLGLREGTTVTTINEPMGAFTADLSESETFILSGSYVFKPSTRDRKTGNIHGLSGNYVSIFLPRSAGTREETLATSREHPLLYKSPVTHRVLMNIVGSREILSVQHKHKKTQCSVASYEVSSSLSHGIMTSESVYTRTSREVPVCEYGDFRALMSQRVALEESPVQIRFSSEPSMRYLSDTRREDSLPVRGPASINASDNENYPGTIRLKEIAVRTHDDGSVTVVQQEAIELGEGTPLPFFSVKIPLIKGSIVKKFSGATQDDENNQVKVFSKTTCSINNELYLEGIFEPLKGRCKLRWICEFFVPSQIAEDFHYTIDDHIIRSGNALPVSMFNMEISGVFNDSLKCEFLPASNISKVNEICSSQKEGIKWYRGVDLHPGTLKIHVFKDRSWKNVALRIQHKLEHVSQRYVTDIAALARSVKVRRGDNRSLRDRWENVLIRLQEKLGEKNVHVSHLEKGFILKMIFAKAGYAVRLFPARLKALSSDSQPSERGFEKALIQVENQWFSPDLCSSGSSSFSRNLIGATIIDLESLTKEQAGSSAPEIFSPGRYENNSRLVEDVKAKLNVDGSVHLFISRVLEGGVAREMGALIHALGSPAMERQMASATEKVFSGALLCNLSTQVPVLQSKDSLIDSMRMTFEVTIPCYALREEIGPGGKGNVCFTAAIPYLPVSGTASQWAISRRTVLEVPSQSRLMSVEKRGTSAPGGTFESVLQLDERTVLWEQEILPEASIDFSHTGKEKGVFAAPCVKYLIYKSL